MLPWTLICFEFESNPGHVFFGGHNMLEIFLCVVHVFLVFSAQLQKKSNRYGTYIYIYTRVYPKNALFIVRFQ